MDDKNNLTQLEIIDLKAVKNIFKKKKKFFIYSLLITLFLSLLITFLFPKEYASKSVITLSSNFYFDNLILKHFPEEFDKLWIIRKSRLKDDRINRLNTVEENLKSKVFQKNVLSNFVEISNYRKFKKTIEIENTGYLLNLTVFARDPLLSFKINKALIEEYNEKKHEEFYPFYKNLLDKVDKKIKQYEQEIQEHSRVSENSNNALTLKEDTTDFYLLKALKKNLIENENYYLNRVEVLYEPDIDDIEIVSHLIRNIIFSIVFSIALSIIFVFAINRLSR